MAWQTIQYKLTSSAPLIMHNGQLADPFNIWTKKIKEISGKRNKTDADYEEIARLEFFGGLYMGEDGPIIPEFVINGMLINGAKKSKEGMIAKSGCYALDHASLEYEGPRTAAELWDRDEFRCYMGVDIRGSRIYRMRPIFNEWNTTISLSIEDTTVNPAAVDKWLEAAGRIVGLCDFRPQYGRFTVERLNGKK